MALPTTSRSRPRYYITASSSSSETSITSLSDVQSNPQQQAIQAPSAEDRHKQRFSLDISRDNTVMPPHNITLPQLQATLDVSRSRSLDRSGFVRSSSDRITKRQPHSALRPMSSTPASRLETRQWSAETQPSPRMTSRSSTPDCHTPEPDACKQFDLPTKQTPVVYSPMAAGFARLRRSGEVTRLPPSRSSDDLASRLFS